MCDLTAHASVYTILTIAELEDTNHEKNARVVTYPHTPSRLVVPNQETELFTSL